MFVPMNSGTDDLGREMARLYPTHYRFDAALGLCRIGTWYHVRRKAEDGYYWLTLRDLWAQERSEARWFMTEEEATRQADRYYQEAGWQQAFVVSRKLETLEAA